MAEVPPPVGNCSGTASTAGAVTEPNYTAGSSDSGRDIAAAVVAVGCFAAGTDPDQRPSHSNNPRPLRREL